MIKRERVMNWMSGFFSYCHEQYFSGEYERNELLTMKAQLRLSEIFKKRVL